MIHTSNGDDTDSEDFELSISESDSHCTYSGDSDEQKVTFANYRDKRQDFANNKKLSQFKKSMKVDAVGHAKPLPSRGVKSSVREINQLMKAFQISGARPY